MKDRGKALETSTCHNDLSDFNYSAPEMPCTKHPNPSSVGICADCLKDRLAKLICSECGEQRLSSCSCSDISSSYRNSCSTMEVGSVGRVSFLIENDKIEQTQNFPKPKRKEDDAERVVLLRRSSSSCVEAKKSNGIWKIRRLFKKKRNNKDGEKNDDKNSEIWVSDVMGVSRSRSMCSFRAGGFDEEGSDYRFSSAKISDVTCGIFRDSGFNEAEARRSGFRAADNVRDSGFSESEARKYGFKAAENDGEMLKGGKQDCNIDQVDSFSGRNFGSVKERDFTGMDESNFIDLKLDFSSESKREPFAQEARDPGKFLAGFKNNEVFAKGGSCRITVSEKGWKRGGRGQKVWRWMFGHHHANKKDENKILKP